MKMRRRRKVREKNSPEKQRPERAWNQKRSNESERRV